MYMALLLPRWPAIPLVSKVRNSGAPSTVRCHGSQAARCSTGKSFKLIAMRTGNGLVRAPSQALYPHLSFSSQMLTPLPLHLFNLKFPPST
jgi:hypothetical protein